MSGQLLRIQDWESMARQAKFHPAGMAALCCISLRQMERFFVKRFNKTPIVWTRELRCQQARQLIAKGWTNKAVAIELGFANESHLCHEFRRVYGSAPRSFAPTYRNHKNVAFLQ
jgi:transcriptional regulator GlxA family with amidase domain